jgi:hypothetical protein
MISPNTPVPAAPPPKAVPLFTTIATVGAVIILAAGAFVLLGDWLAGWHLTRPWLQLSAAFVGVMLLITVVRVPTMTRPRRLVVCAGGMLLILAVLDSLDGQQDVLPLIVVLLSIWALGYADTTAQLVATGRPTTRRRWFAVTIGILSTLVYLGAASYYGTVNLIIAPVNIDHHPLFAFGIVIATFLRWVGELEPYGGPLTGAIRICPSCGLRNIRERTTCKRCGTRLGSVEHVT